MNSNSSLKQKKDNNAVIERKHTQRKLSPSSCTTLPCAGYSSHSISSQTSFQCSDSSLSFHGFSCREIETSNEVYVFKESDESQILVDFPSDDDDSNWDLSMNYDSNNSNISDLEVNERRLDPYICQSSDESRNPFAEGFNSALSQSTEDSALTASNHSKNSQDESPFTNVGIERRRASRTRRRTLLSFDDTRSPSTSQAKRSYSGAATRRTSGSCLPFLPSQLPARPLEIPSIFREDNGEKFIEPIGKADVILEVKEEVMVSALQDIALRMVRHSKY